MLFGKGLFSYEARHVEYIYDQDNAEVASELADRQGRLIRHSSYGTLSAGTHEKSVDVTSLSAGMYYINLQIGTKQERRKSIVTH